MNICAGGLEMTEEEEREIDRQIAEERAIDLGFLKTQPAEATWLYEHDQLWISNGKMLLNMNDTFAYACGDAEYVATSEIPEVVRIYKQYGDIGLTCWAARKRKENPVIEYTEDPVYQATWRELYGELTVGQNYCNTKVARWSNRKLNLEKWTPIED